MVHQFRKAGAYFCYLLFMLLVLVSVGFAQEIDTGNIVILPETDVVQVDISASPFTSINGWQAASDVPSLVDVHTRRNAGSQLVEALATVDVTDLTIGVSGLVPATQAVISLNQDPTGEDPYDNLNDGTTSFIVVSVPSGAARFIAETFESAGANVDLFMGTGLTPNADTEICAGTGETAVEVCNVDTPIAGDWWILVQNRAESSAPPDTFTLAYGVVSNDVGNMWVEAPSTVPPASVFELNVLWDEPALAAGDLWYGSFTVGSDPGQPENIGRVNVDLERHEDDVEKIVSAETAVPGDVLTYTITIQPNVTPIDLTYYITDTIPAGLTYVPNSATASVGQVSVLDDTLTWSDLLPIGHTYDVVTSLEEPTCSPPLAEADGEVDDYLDLAAFGIVPDPNIIGNSVVYSVIFDGGEFDFFGADRGELIYFTDDGFAFFAPSGPGLSPGTNEPIPTAADPNNLMALYWRDLELVYDQALNRGVSLVNLTSDGSPVAAVVEFDDVEETPAGTGLPTYDFEIIAYYDPGPDHYEFIFAYDNLTPADGIGTIGLESQSGTSGVQYAYNDVAISDGMAICYDLIEAGNATVEVTYQVRVDVDAQGSLENQAVHKTNDPGSKEESVSATVMVAGSSSTKLLISSNSGGYANDLPFADEDILLFDMGTNIWSMYFDGSDLGLRPADIDALHIMDDGTILMSFSQRFKVPRLGKVDDSDIVRFIPISLGEDTDGSFELFFDGSDVGLTSNGEDVDAINVTEDGRLIVSTSGNFRIPANRCWWHWISKKCGHDVEVDETLGSNHEKKRPHFKNMLLGRDEDLIVFDPTDLGKKTKGTWDYYLNGWAAQLMKEDIWGVWVDDATDDIYLTVQNKFELDSVGGDGQDIFVCHPIFLGMFTSCDYESVLFFDGSETGLGRQRINGFSIIR